MNLLRGTLQDGVVRAGDLSLRVAGAADGAVIVGFRPEALLPAQQGAGLPQLQMTVEVVEELGNETLIYGDVPGEVATVEIDPTLPAPLPGARARLCARLSGFSDVRPGETVPLALRLDRVHLFEAAGGEALASASPPAAGPD